MVAKLWLSSILTHCVCTLGPPTQLIAIEVASKALCALYCLARASQAKQNCGSLGKTCFFVCVYSYNFKLQGANQLVKHCNREVA